jgi:hypothetical protein
MPRRRIPGCSRGTVAPSSRPQRRSETGGSGVDLLLKDAAQFLERALKTKPRDAKLLFDRAKTAYFAGDYATEERFALEAEAAAGDPDRIEAERWVGDASARLLGVRYLGDPAVAIGGILRGGRALWRSRPAHPPTEWFGSASGPSPRSACTAKRAAILQLATERIPASAVVRSLNNELALGGGSISPRPRRSGSRRGIRPRRSRPGSRDTRAFSHAENSRREEDPPRAISSYRRPEGLPPFVESAPSSRARTLSALCAMGRGFARLLADAGRAARCLVEAASSDRSPSLHDGLTAGGRPRRRRARGAQSGASPVGVRRSSTTSARGARRSDLDPRRVRQRVREAPPAGGEIVGGDRYLRASIDVGRRAVAISGTTRRSAPSRSRSRSSPSGASRAATSAAPRSPRRRRSSGSPSRRTPRLRI